MALDDLQTCYEFVENLTKEAGKIVVEGFYGIKHVERKGGRSYDLVTEYDKKVEDFLISSIKEKYPDHLFIGEETSAAKNATPALTDSPTWIIDPIDGTTNFVHGIPIIGISIALAVKKDVVMGIVYNPVTKEFFSAAKGKGAFLNGKKIQSSKNEDLNEGILSNEISLARVPFLKDRTMARLQKAVNVAQGVRSIGSAAISLCYVANGAFDGYFTDGLKCWDVAAGKIIIEEAGGCLFNPNGGEFDMFSRVLASAGNEVLKNKLIDIFKDCDVRTKNEITEKYLK